VSPDTTLRTKQARLLWQSTLPVNPIAEIAENLIYVTWECSKAGCGVQSGGWKRVRKQVLTNANCRRRL
jgi:hypothetical protein